MEEEELDPILGIQGESQSSKPLESVEESLDPFDQVTEDANNKESADLFDQVSTKHMSDQGEYRQTLDEEEREAWDDIQDKYGQFYMTPSSTETMEGLGERQGAGEQFLRGATRVLPNALFELIGSVGSALDLEDYWNTDEEIGNWLTDWADEMKEAVTESTAIYQEKPGESWNVGDFGWWMENGSNLASSAASFMALGLGVGQGLQALKWMNSLRQATGMGLKTSEMLSQGGNTLVSSLMMNQAESIGTATQVFNDTYTKALAQGKTVDEANTMAAKAAEYSITVNRFNIPLNLTSMHRFMRPAKTGSQLVKEVGKKQALKEIGKEGAQEYLEENVNLIAEKEGEALGDALLQGKNHSTSFTDVINTMASAEGTEAGFWGFLGGAIQTGGTEVLNNVKTTKRTVRDDQGNIVYKKTGPKAYIPKDIYSTLKKKKDDGDKITEADIDEAIKNSDISEDGVNRLKQAFLEDKESMESLKEGEAVTERVSKNQIKTEQIAKKIEAENKLVKNLPDNGKSLLDAVRSGDEYARSAKDLDILDTILDPEVFNNGIKRDAVIEKLKEDAKSIDDQEEREAKLKEIEELRTISRKDLMEKREAASEKMLETHFYNVAEADAVPAFVRMFEGMRDLNQDEAIKKGFDPETYKADATKALERIKELSKMYDKYKGLSYPDITNPRVIEKEFYKRQLEVDRAKKEYDKTYTEVTTRQAEIENTLSTMQKQGRGITDSMYKKEKEELDAKLLDATIKFGEAEKSLAELKTKKGRAAVQDKAQQDMIKHLEEAFEEEQHAQRLGYLKEIQDEASFVLETEEGPGVLSYNEEKKYYEYTEPGKLPKRVTREMSQKLYDKVITEEFKEKNLARLKRKRVLAMKKEAIATLTEVKEKQIVELDAKIERAKEAAANKKAELEELKISYEIALEEYAGKGFIPADGYTVTLPSGREYTFTEEGKVFNSKGEELVKNSSTKSAVIKQLYKEEAAFREEMARMLNEREEEINAVEDDLDFLQETVDDLTAVQDAIYDSLAMIDTKEDVLLDADNDFKKLWEEAEEEFNRKWPRKDIEDMALELGMQKSDIEDRIAEIRSDLEELREIANQVKMSGESYEAFIKLAETEDSQEALIEKFNEKLAVISDHFGNIEYVKDLKIYKELLEELSKFYDKVEKVVNKELEKVTDPVSRQNSDPSNRGENSYKEIKNKSEDEIRSDSQKRKLSAFTTAGNHLKAVDENDENSLRWFNAMNQISTEDGYALEFVSYERASADDKYKDVFSPEQIAVEEDYKAKTGKVYNGIKAVLVKPDGSFATSDVKGNLGKGSYPVTMTMHSENGEIVAYKKGDDYETDLEIKTLVYDFLVEKITNDNKGRGSEDLAPIPTLDEINTALYRIGEDKFAEGERNKIQGYEELNSREFKNAILKEIADSIKKFRDDVRAKGAKGESAFAGIILVSGGHAMPAYTDEGELAKSEIVGEGGFVKKIEDIARVSVNRKGHVVLTDNKEHEVVATLETLTDDQVETVLEILDLSLNTGDPKTAGKGVTLHGFKTGKKGEKGSYGKDAKPVPVFYNTGLKEGGYSLIETFIYWGKAAEGKDNTYQIYYDEDKQVVHYGPEGIVKFEDMKTDEDFRDFLKSKKFNFNGSVQKKKKGQSFSRVFLNKKGVLQRKSVEPEGNLSGYEVHMINNLKVSLEVDEDNNPKFFQRYVQFTQNTFESVEKAEEEIERETNKSYNTENAAEEEAAAEEFTAIVVPSKKKKVVPKADAPKTDAPAEGAPFKVTLMDAAEATDMGVDLSPDGAEVDLSRGPSVDAAPAVTVSEDASELKDVFGDVEAEEAAAEEAAKPVIKDMSKRRKSRRSGDDSKGAFKLAPDVASKIDAFLAENASDLIKKGVSLDTTSIINAYINSELGDLDVFLDLYAKKLKC